MKLFRYKKLPSKDELYVRDIVQKFLDDKDVKKRIAPITSTVYLENDKEGIYVRIHYLNNRVDFSSGDFLYKKDIDSNFCNTLIESCKKKIEEELQEVDKLLEIDEITLLQKILKKYDDKN